MKKIILIILFLLSLKTSAFDIKKEIFYGVKKLTIEYYDGYNGFKDGYIYVHYFDNEGRAIQSLHFFKKNIFNKKLIGSYEYQYNDKGLLSKKIETYNVNKQHPLKTYEYEYDAKNLISKEVQMFLKDKNLYKDTTSYLYEYDTIGRLVCKIEKSIWTKTEYYKNFDDNNNFQTVIINFDGRIRIENKKYDSIGNEIYIEKIINDTTYYIEEKKYNEFGDLIYSNIPTLLDKETGEMVVLLGGNRFAIIEEYEYVYDKLNRWIEKYVIYDNKKKLIEKRIFE